jgi:hypothetical protein
MKKFEIMKIFSILSFKRRRFSKNIKYVPNGKEFSNYVEIVNLSPLIGEEFLDYVKVNIFSKTEKNFATMKNLSSSPV